MLDLLQRIIDGVLVTFILALPILAMLSLILSPPREKRESRKKDDIPYFLFIYLPHYIIRKDKRKNH